MSLKSLLILNQKTDAVDVPEVGKIHMFLQGTTIKYKDSNNVDYTLATGVSPEDVQDIVGSFIATGSNKLTAVYDDVLNIIILDVDDTKIDHVNLLNKGTNTHAQLDAHVASTANPHNTTAAQVGADPSGTAAAAIAAHVASADPHSQYTTNAEATSLAQAQVTAHEAAVNPHPQYETSAEAQAKVDAHANLTNNPHGVTKAQVGLSNVDNTSDANKPVSTATQTALNGKENSIVATTAADYYRGDKTFQPLNKAAVGLANVDNTSDANKPISTAVQTALNLKYDASNPSGFETPAQLNARDTANRSRANHTGSQLASTISDFSTAVLSTIIAGVVFTANISIAATDSVLEAFGKLQAQINYILSVLSTLVIGDNFEDFNDNTVFTTTSNVNQVAASFLTAAKAIGRYRVGITWDWTISSNTSDSIFSVWLDGVQVSGEFRLEHSETVTQRLNNSWFFYTTFASVNTHTLELRARAETNGVTVTVNDVRAEIWRANA